MDEQYGAYLTFARQWCHMVLAEGNWEAALACATEDVVWAGSGVDHTCQGKEAVRTLADVLSRQPMTLTDVQLATAYGDQNSCLVTGDLCLEIPGTAQHAPPGQLRVALALLCVRREERLRWRYVQLALQGRDLLEVLERQSWGQLQAQLEQRTRELEEVYQQKQEQEMRYRFALEATHDVIFELDMETGAVTAKEAQMRRLFDLPPDADMSMGVLQVAQSRVHPEDQERHSAFFDTEVIRAALAQGVTTWSAEFRVAQGVENPSYIWLSETMVPIRNIQGEVVTMLGNVKNINEQKLHELQMQQMAQRDSLTGLYNKMATQAAVTNFIQAHGDRGRGVLFIVDIDDFKSINDNMGHLLGDAVLSDLSQQLLRLFRSDDILGRIGGDEFLIFIKDMEEGEAATARAEALVDIFRRSGGKGKAKYHISGSVGAAYYPRDGRTYSELFEHADWALYHAKRQGKDCYEFYQPGMAGDRHWQETRDQPLEREAPLSLNDNVVAYIFSILYESRDVVSAVELILSIVGKRFDVSRAYIFENTPDGKYCNNTFEWCNEGIEPEQDNLQRMPYAMLGDYPSNFNEEGIFYCTDIHSLDPDLYAILAPQNIHSMLQCAIFCEGKFSGYVGFDECNSHRYWMREEVEALTFISQLLSTFLIKERIQHRLSEAFAITQSVLDHQNLWTYVIDQDSYELLFINRKTQAIAPGASVGDKCYEAFWNRRQPCAQCPMQGLVGSGGAECTMELFNHNLRVWTNATASIIPWVDGRQVCLMSCSDVTRYKQGRQGDGQA